MSAHALCGLLACAQTTEPATQIVFRIDSDLTAGAELTKVTVEVLHTDGSGDGATRFPAVLLAEDGSEPGDDGRKTLPLSGSITEGSEQKVLLHVVGWGALTPGDPSRVVVEQHASLRFQRGKTHLVRIFLGEVCVDKDCDSALGLVCYPTALAGVAAGECGPIEALSDAITVLGVSPEALPGLASGARDAGGSFEDADLEDADLEDAGVDVDADTGDAADDCVGNACQNGATCVDGISAYTCDCAGTGYTGARCETLVDECVENACQHGAVCMAGAAGTYSCDCGATGYSGTRCETDVNECASNNLCTFPAYPCVQTAPPGYTCQGQFAEWPMPDALPGSKVAPSYDVTTTPGVVIDRVTGLNWQRALPATYDGCTGRYSSGQGQVGDACTWSEAKSYCAALVLAGQSDWRLPSKIELESILDETKVNIPIDVAAFPSTPGRLFWSASPYVGASDRAWIVYFNAPGVYNNTVGDAYLVRCVR